MAETAKIASMGILFLLSCLSGILMPYIVLKILTSRCNSMSRFKTILSALNCFSAGVFISTSLLILLPEGREMTDEAMGLLNADIEYPITELLAGFGFLLILFIESVVTACHERHSRNAVSRETQPRANGVARANGVPRANGATPDTVSYQNGHVIVYTVEDANSPVEEVVNETNHDHAVIVEGMSVVQSIALLIALSIHMIFDGLSLGLVDEDEEVWKLLIALSIHKTLIFFSMGLHVSESTTLCKFVAAMVYISAVSPVGVGIGILMSSEKNSIPVTTASAALQSVATGTFIYVAMFEVLLKELSNSDYKIMKVFFVLFGYIFLAVLKFVVH